MIIGAGSIVGREYVWVFWPPTPWPLPPLNGWYVEVLRKDSETRVTLNTVLWKGEDGQRFRAVSSAWRHLLLVEDEWTSGVAARIKKRLGDNDGGEKGRVLYVTRAIADNDHVPLAVAAWHMPPDEAPDEPLELLELDVALSVAEHDPNLEEFFGETLLAALRNVALHPKVSRPGDRLAWITDDRDTALRAYNDWQFSGLAKDKRPEHNKAKFYLRRTEA